MEIRIRDDVVEVEGYVNAVERLSKPLRSRIGSFVERVRKGAFRRALARRSCVRLLLNHDGTRELANTADGTLELNEDNIGLHARATITDAEVVEKARKGELVGWSFGFSDIDVEQSEENGVATRNIRDLELYEVSILDKTKTPAYDGTSVTVRSDEQDVHFADVMESEPVVREEKTPVDYAAYEKAVREMKYKDFAAYAAYRNK